MYFQTLFLKKAIGIFLLISLGGLPVFAQAFQVGERTLSLYDSARQRPVKTELWYPTKEKDPDEKRRTDLPFILDATIRNAQMAEGKYPLILLSHGTGGNRFGLAWLAITLANNGYIVAAPDHYGNTFDNKIPAYFVRYWERPLDISFIITQLQQDQDISAHINSESIGMAGFSFGGYTALALAGLEINCSQFKKVAQTEEAKKEFNIPELGDLTGLIGQISCADIKEDDLSDSRIKAFVAMSPALGIAVDTTQSWEGSEHIFLIGAEEDQIAPVKTNAGMYHDYIPQSAYMEIAGEAGHYVFLCVGDKSMQKHAKTYYKDARSVNRTDIHDEVSKAIRRFFVEEGVK